MKPNIGIERASSFVIGQVQHSTTQATKASRTTGSRGAALHVSKFRIDNWEEGMASMEAMMLDTVDQNSAYEARRARVE